ncbi:DUF4097 family beta strand repeat-containing protein [Pedobacter namyangjuensis]|uniref:hypothetical protein n=1 Tax=Pedobacter namyangjuensis TaxID=600626 RepID=UPI0013B36B7F|nr:hypothetical protein [Pedobacter namyangjuensis]
MKKRIIILFALIISSLMVNAQKEYRMNKSTGHLKLNLNGIVVEGYDGKEIIFSSKNTPAEEVDQRAKGLVAIAGSGFTDNTGIGINVKENGQDIIVNNIYSNNSDRLTIKVPKGMKVSFNNNSMQYYDDVTIKNINGEIEVSTRYNKIRLENNLGPMNINSINGSVDAVFTSEIKGPISIISIYDYVDVKLLTTTKGDIELATNYGKLYAAKEFAIAVEKTEAEKTINKPIATTTTTTTTITGSTGGTTNINKSIGNQINNNLSQTLTFGYSYNEGEKIKGKLNGGGINMIFKSINNNVYLRHQ